MAGPDVYICAECIRLCNEILASPPYPDRFAATMTSTAQARSALSGHESGGSMSEEQAAGTGPSPAVSARRRLRFRGQIKLDPRERPQVADRPADPPPLAESHDPAAPDNG